ncbi:glutaredoxin [Vespertiliibacter pulmonis]|uniref:Glutaredoxin 1 n=1 Tax=Vespertiliibacter pulmonis TaxID=1443036 RepID=A0A3N4VCM1_9PAST|nr:GrxA family glutaredoxin [Vespertiliibacter pulmonis]QLB20968.1 glutaredoxin [Vespertiliibacter pulmonis]RPE80742.1 glutaredoxin 1 [Vespertiliibacter pulmonis]
MYVEIFGRMTCPYCVKAKQLAEKMKAELPDFDFEFIDMEVKGISKADLEPRVGKPVATVPQVFLDNEHIGGYSDFAPVVQAKFGITL